MRSKESRWTRPQEFASVAFQIERIVIVFPVPRPEENEPWVLSTDLKPLAVDVRTV